MKTGLLLIKNVLTSLSKSTLELTSAVEKKVLGSGTITLIFSNEELNDIMKITKSLEDSNLLIKGVTETIENEVKEQKRGFLGMLTNTLGASLLGDILAGKSVLRAGKKTNRAGWNF